MEGKKQQTHDACRRGESSFARMSLKTRINAHIETTKACPRGGGGPEEHEGRQLIPDPSLADNQQLTTSNSLFNPQSSSPHPTPGAPAESQLERRAPPYPRRARATACRVCAAASLRSCVSSRSLACVSRTYTGFLPKRSPFTDISDSRTSQVRAAASVQPAPAQPLVTQSARQVTDIPIFIRSRRRFTRIQPHS